MNKDQLYREMGRLVSVSIRQLAFSAAQLRHFDETSTTVLSTTAHLSAKLAGSKTPYHITLEVFQPKEGLIKCSIHVTIDGEIITMNKGNCQRLFNALFSEFGVRLEGDIDDDVDQEVQLPLYALF